MDCVVGPRHSSPDRLAVGMSSTPEPRFRHMNASGDILSELGSNASFEDTDVSALPSDWEVMQVAECMGIVAYEVVLRNPTKGG